MVRAPLPSPELTGAIASALGASVDAVLLLDADANVLFANEAARLREETFRAAREAVDVALRAAFTERRSTTFEWGEHGPAGVRAWFACTVSPVIEQEAVVAALASSKDVTEAKRVEARLRRSEQLMVDTQGVAHLGTWEWDVSEPNASWSAELYRIYGLTPETYTPSYEAYLTKVHADDRQRVIDATNRVFHEHIPYSHDERVFRPDGSMRYLHTWAFPVLDDAGKLTKLVGVCQDITDQKNAEAEVLHLNASLEQRVADRTRTIERSLRDLEAFQAMVSHDLRAPLSVIALTCSVMEREGGLTETVKKHVQRVQGSVSQMTRLVNDLLTLAHVGNSRLEKSEVDLSELCEDVFANLRHVSRERGQVAPPRSTSVAPSLRCQADPNLLRTVVDNLLGNAWKYSSRAASPRIEVGCATDVSGDGKPAFFVKDNGVGFEMKDAERLFAPFERLDTATDFEGTGVGLAAVHRIIERHGGRIWAESTPGAGATFYFTLA